MVVFQIGIAVIVCTQNFSVRSSVVLQLLICEIAIPPLFP